MQGRVLLAGAGELQPQGAASLASMRLSDCASSMLPSIKIRVTSALQPRLLCQDLARLRLCSRDLGAPAQDSLCKETGYAQLNPGQVFQRRQPSSFSSPSGRMSASTPTSAHVCGRGLRRGKDCRDLGRPWRLGLQPCEDDHFTVVAYSHKVSESKRARSITAQKWQCACMHRD